MGLEPAKQMRILNAAYHEFTLYGYEQASTNRIVKNAGIGKGMLFYYFKSKKDLFYYLIDYGFKFVMEEYLSKINEGERDFLEKCRQFTEIKMKALEKAPQIFTFLANLHLREKIDLPQGLEALGQEMQNAVQAKLYASIDTSLFRDDINPEKIIKLIQWSLDGYTNELILRFKSLDNLDVDYNPWRDDFYEFLAVLRKLYYK